MRVKYSLPLLTDKIAETNNLLTAISLLLFITFIVNEIKHNSDMIIESTN